jgi:hypothetical protein
MPDVTEYPVAAWVAALEAAVRAGDYHAAAHAGDELRRRGVEVRLLRDRRQAVPHRVKTNEVSADAR